jgi:hypothetical protein
MEMEGKMAGEQKRNADRDETTRTQEAPKESHRPSHIPKNARQAARPLQANCDRSLQSERHNRRSLKGGATGSDVTSGIFLFPLSSRPFLTKEKEKEERERFRQS